MTSYKTMFVLILMAGANPNGFAANPKTEDDSHTTIHQDAATDVGPILQKLDVNHDGLIDKKEAHQLRGLTETFDSADADKDGKVNPAELSKFLAPSTN